MHAWETIDCPPYRKLLTAEMSREGVYSHGQSVILKVRLEDFVVAVSQHESKHPFDFSLKVFLESQGELQVERLPYLPKSRAALTGRWTEENTGASAKSSAYGNNPCFCLEVPKRESVILFLESTHQCSLNLRLFPFDMEAETDAIQCSGAYKFQCCCIGPCELDVGKYRLIASNFNSRMGDFRVDLRAAHASLYAIPSRSSVPCRVSVVPENLSHRSPIEAR